MVRRKGKRKAGASGSGTDTLLAASDFTDFHDVDFQPSTRSGSPEELDSETEDAIYAQMYFNTSNDAALSSLFNEGIKPVVLELMGGGEASGHSAVTRKGSGSKVEPNFSPADAVSHSRQKVQSPNESSPSNSTGEEVLEFSFKKNTEDRSQKKKKKKKKTSKASRVTSEGKGSRSSDSSVLKVGGKRNRTAETTGENASAQRRGQSTSSGSHSSLPEADIHRVFTSSSKGELKKSKPSSCDADGCSSLEQGEIVSSSSSPARVAGSSDMDISSGSAGGDSQGKDGSSNTSDPWEIIEKDKLGRDAYDRLYGLDDASNRYYGSREKRCRNCKQKGHTNLDCPWPKRSQVCYLCAKTGHVRDNCPQGLCPYCFQRQHKGRPCSSLWNSRSTECTRCHMRGHHAAVCPEQWRQYHHTLYDHNYLVVRDGDRRTDMRNIYCYNCSKKSHFGFECHAPPPRFSTCHTPLVSHHDRQVWPPRDPHNNGIIRHALMTRPPPPPPPPHLPETARPPPPPPPEIPMSSSSQETRTFEAPHKKRRLEKSGNGTAGEFQDVPNPPKKKRRRKSKGSRNQESVSNSLLSDNVESISSDELVIDDDLSLVIAVPGASGSRHGSDRRVSHGGSTLGEHQHLHFLDDSYRGASVNQSFSTSPFTNMYGGRTNAPQLASTPSSLLGHAPFPHSQHNNHSSSPSVPRRHHNTSYSRQLSHHRKSQEFNQMSSIAPSRRDSTGMYSPHDGSFSNDYLVSTPPPSSHSRNLPLLSRPDDRFPREPFPNEPMRSFSSRPTHAPPPPQINRRLSEPVSSAHKSSTPASRHNSYRDEEYTTSSRGFRMSNQRAAQMGHDRYNPSVNPRHSSSSERRYSAGYRKY